MDGASACTGGTGYHCHPCAPRLAMHPQTVAAMKSQRSGGGGTHGVELEELLQGGQVLALLHHSHEGPAGRRAGGGWGPKSGRSAHVGSACAPLRRPCWRHQGTGSMAAPQRNPTNWAAVSSPQLGAECLHVCVGAGGGVVGAQGRHKLGARVPAQGMNGAWAGRARKAGSGGRARWRWGATPPCRAKAAPAPSTSPAQRPSNSPLPQGLT